MSLYALALRLMRKRSSNTPSRDENRAALVAIARLTGSTPEELRGKNPAAVALGRMGGKKGGPARAKKLSAQRRQQIARDAARARWRTK